MKLIARLIELVRRPLTMHTNEEIRHYWPPVEDTPGDERQQADAKSDSHVLERISIAG